MSGDAAAAVRRLSIDCTDIGREVLSVVKIVLDDAQTADDARSVQTEIPAVFCFVIEIGVHAVQICRLGNAPFLMEPLGCLVLQLRQLPQCEVCVGVHMHASQLDDF